LGIACAQSSIRPLAKIPALSAWATLATPTATGLSRLPACRATVLLVALTLVACPLLRADCSLTATGTIPINDFGPGSYQGLTAGLYPAGSNTPPAAHAAAALAVATDEIRPLNASGTPDPVNGRIVMISIGMSNTTQEFATKGTQHFKLRADADPAKNPQLIIVDGAQGGQDAPAWINPTAATWNIVNQRLTVAGVTAQQVQVAWLKQALAGPNNYGAFPAHAQALQSDLEIIARNLKTNFPNIKITYLSPRTRSYTNTPTALNPEPFAYETGFAVKWAVEDQISGAGNLNFDPANGTVVAPLLLWGPYIWADGLTPRSDGFTWLCSDLESDFTHPNASGGVPKVATHLLAFFKTDPTAVPWFLRGSVTGQPPQVTAGASVSSGPAPLGVNFTASAIDPDGTITGYQWTFDDGTFSATQNPTKTFPAPGSYSVHLTVTDNSGNTTLRTLPISVAPAQSSPTPPPTPSPTPTLSVTPSPTATATPTPSDFGGSPTATATATATASPTPTATAFPPPSDGFDPNANGSIHAVFVQPDGKILLGGYFTTLSPNGGATIARNYIARLNPDGSLDTAFNPDANSAVTTIAMQADGKILVGGGFTAIGGQPRHRIARLDPSTGLADSWDPNANMVVNTIAVQADGKILVGGSFQAANSIGGQLRNRIARLDPVTGLADSFNPNANGTVYSIVLQADGRILVGGYFAEIGGATRQYLGRLDPMTGQADSFDPHANSYVASVAVQADGNVLAVGGFTSIGGQMRAYIARVDSANGLADSFSPNANNLVESIAVQADGKILAGGQFTSIGGQARNRIARLDPATGLADSFDPNANIFSINAAAGGAVANGAMPAATPETPPPPTATPTPPGDVLAIAVQADGKILLGGGFVSLAPNGGPTVTRNHIARVEIDGRLDRTLTADLNFASSVYATALQPDGKILLGGQFSTVFGVPRNNIARLNTDGTVDMAFNPNANNPVVSIVVQADGKILVGGSFNNIGGQTRHSIARLDATGAADSFDPNGDGVIDAIARQADGGILVVGLFDSIGGQPRHNIARLNPSTGLADSFNPNASNFVHTVAVQADGKILAGGQFTSIGGSTRNHIARLDADTGLADSFNPNANGIVGTIAVQTDGKILVSGDFSSIGGQFRNHVARLSPTFGAADSFDPSPNSFSGVTSFAAQANGQIVVGGSFAAIGGQTRSHLARLDATTGLADSFNPIANSFVYSVAAQADGKILAGGAFMTMGGEPRSHFARISNDTAALQDLSATQAAITWMRGGSSVQFTRVTFEYSANNVIYTSLGNGTASGNNWVLTGFNLPTEQNFYIRARGYYRSGDQNGSESIAESVRNAFIAGPGGTPSPTATATATATASPTVTPTSTPTPSATPTPTLTPTPMPAAQPLNLSTRMRVQTGDKVGIGGFIITGTAPKHVLLRAIGPSLTQFGVPDALADPVMELHGPTGFATVTNNNWQDDPVQAALIVASGLAPTNDLESAIDATLAPGNYTAVVKGNNNTSGVALVEVYDLNQTSLSKLGNISTRAFVTTGDNIVIAGFILGGNNGNDRIGVRGLGTSLLLVTPALADPTLELRDGNGALLAFNNDWQDDPAQAAELMAAGLAPPFPPESAIAITLPPGLYTALLAGRNNSSGHGLVEIYDRGAP
jgi:uncharacterized delta-60 repeat protein